MKPLDVVIDYITCWKDEFQNLTISKTKDINGFLVTEEGKKVDYKCLTRHLKSWKQKGNFINSNWIEDICKELHTELHKFPTDKKYIVLYHSLDEIRMCIPDMNSRERIVVTEDGVHDVAFLSGTYFTVRYAVVEI